MILGTGWGGARVARDIDTSKYDITIISPRNHMVFTPLLGEGVLLPCLACPDVRAGPTPPAMHERQHAASAACSLHLRRHHRVPVRDRAHRGHPAQAAAAAVSAPGSGGTAAPSAAAERSHQSCQHWRVPLPVTGELCG